MKRKAFKTLLLALVAVLASDFSALAASPFASLTERSDLCYTFVSKELAKTQIYKLHRGGIDFISFIPEIESFYIFEATERTAIEACQKAIKDFQKSARNFEVLMTSKDGKEINLVYGIPMANNDDSKFPKYKSIIFYRESEGEVNILIVNDEPPTIN